jgi:peroxidase
LVCYEIISKEDFIKLYPILFAYMSKFGKKLEITSLGTGAHTIGVAHCSAFANRLSPTVDSTLNPIFAALLETECPSGSTETVNLDVSTPTKFDQFYYLNLRANKGLLTSDQELQSDPSTSGFVNANSFLPTFAANFRNAIIAMGNINVLTGTAGNIRLNCRKFNA